MIRPITVICWVLALGAGLYLYRAKHDVELIDQRIDQIAKQTADLRSQSRRLLDDWIRLGEPERLHKYSDEYLGLKTIAPTQFARLGDLAARLPAPEADPPPEPDPVAELPAGVVADAAPGAVAAADSDRVDEASADDLPVPPIPPVMPPVTTISFQGGTAALLQAKPVSPRPAGSSQTEAERPRPTPPVRITDEPRTAAPPRVTEEPRTAPVRPAPMPPADARLTATAGTPGPTNTPAPDTREAGNGAPGTGRPAWPARGLPPIQAQGPATFQSAPPRPAPAMAQGTVRPMEHGPGQGISGQPAYRPAEPRVADVRASEPRREERPMPPRQAQLPPQPQQMPAQAQTMDRAPQIARQAPMPGPAPGGSLLGMSRGPVPLPLPAPLPVSAAWPPAGQGR